jgi:C1A family cysteine protease
VTKIKNQGQCGACYIFSTTAAIEGRCAVQDWPKESLSTQRILDCLPGDHGCLKGLQSHVYKYGIANDGFAMWNDYDSYHASIGKCHGRNDHIHSLYGFGRMRGDDNYPAREQRLIKHLQWGPVSSALCTQTNLLQFVGAGVLKGETCTKLSHGITIVGYGEDEDTGDKFWKIKNSWGEHWGEEGYARLCRGMKCGTKDPLGFLGIAKQVFYPECKKPNEKYKSITKEGPPADVPRTEKPGLFSSFASTISIHLPGFLQKW